VGSILYVVSQVRADNTFAIFKSIPTSGEIGGDWPGYNFETTAVYTFPTINGKNNSSFDPVVAYDSTGQVIYIVGTQDDADGKDIDVLMFSYSTATDTWLRAPVTLVTASYVRDSYDVCILGSQQFIAVAVTNPSIIWKTPTVSNVTEINITGSTLTVYAYNSYSVGQRITFSGLQNATFLNGVTVTVASVAVDGSYFTANYTLSPPANYTQVGYESGYATWLPGHSLIGFQLADSASPPTAILTVLDSSPFSTGNTFGAVSTYSPDGNNIEVYYESHPKLITFTDQYFNINLASKVSGSWLLPSTILNTFSGRYVDNRLTVIPSGTNRTLLQQYYSQVVHQNALIGNLLFGYYNGTQWKFHINPGSSTTSYIQGTLSVADTAGTFVSYLAEPVYSIRGEWSPQVKHYAVNDRVRYNSTDYLANRAVVYNYQGMWTKETSYVTGSIVMASLATDPVTYAYYTANNNILTSTIAPNLDTINWSVTPTPNVDSRFSVAPTMWPLKTSSLNTSTFNMSDVPGFYNTLNFTWLRGTKTVLDDLSKWGVIGEQAGSVTSGATYVSDFDVPPVVRIIPSSTVTAYRAEPIIFDASGTNDGDLDPLQFTWTYSPGNANVTLIPSSSGSKATFLANRAIGGSAEAFTVGVVAVDYNGVTPLHPPMTVTNIAVSSGTLTVTTTATVDLANGESVFLYNLVSATFLNDTVVTVTGSSGNYFTATISHANYSASDTGMAIANAQFAFCGVTVPFNAAPTIDFTHDAITHDPVTLPIAAARNAIIRINPTYTGVTDPDDATTYTWVQNSGTAIPPNQILSGTNAAYLQFETNGIPLIGDTLIWSLTVNDGVNSPVTQTVQVDVAAYPFSTADTLRLSRSVWSGNISQRNSAQTWAALSPSVMYTNLKNVKRSSVLNGTDRYLLISPASVSVYGIDGLSVVLVRKLYVPDNVPVVDAVHTEDDWTFVLDSTNKLYQYTAPSLIYTDDPNTTIDLTTLSTMSFNKVFTTVSFANSRILALTGPDGCLLLQLRNTDLLIQGTLSITVEDKLLYGVDNVQFIRTSSVESLNTGRLLLGTIAQVVVNITSIAVLNNTVTVVAPNTLTQEEPVTFAGLTHATFLNGVTASVVSATATQFIVSYQCANYTTTLEGAGATATTGGKTYETLIDLSHGQIIGTWDASKLRNQFVTTGEILFEANDTYSGRPIAPVLSSIVNTGALAGDIGYTNISVSWTASRSDLIQYYNLEVSSDNINWSINTINSGFINAVTLPEPTGQLLYFRIMAFSVDGNSPYSNVQSIYT
jgi:hypothetical protein